MIGMQGQQAEPSPLIAVRHGPKSLANPEAVDASTLAIFGFQAGSKHTNLLILLSSLVYRRVL
jgi:hypothetical protein